MALSLALLARRLLVRRRRRRRAVDTAGVGDGRRPPRRRHHDRRRRAGAVEPPCPPRHHRPGVGIGTVPAPPLSAPMEAALADAVPGWPTPATVDEAASAPAFLAEVPIADVRAGLATLGGGDVDGHATSSRSPTPRPSWRRCSGPDQVPDAAARGRRRRPDRHALLRERRSPATRRRRSTSCSPGWRPRGAHRLRAGRDRRRRRRAQASAELSPDERPADRLDVQAVRARRARRRRRRRHRRVGPAGHDPRRAATARAVGVTQDGPTARP